MVDGFGSIRYADIIAIDKNSPNAYILDPTVRYENNEEDQDEIIASEKRNIYESCIPDCMNKYSSYGLKNWSVVGLWFGTRGTVGQSVIKFFEEQHLDKNRLVEISTRILSDSINIIHRHIYN